MNWVPAPIDLAQEAEFALGSVRIRPALRQWVGEEEQKLIEPRVMQVLVALARQTGGVVSRDELVALCWSGRIVGEDAIQRAVAKVRRLGDASGAFAIETIAKVGYRLVATGLDCVRGDDARQRLSGAVIAPNGVQQVRPAASASGLDPTQVTLALAQLPSVGVLPFVNLTGDADQDYFVDGTTEDIITALSRFREIRTAPRGSSFAFRAVSLEMAEVARRLGVDYILTGSVRMAEKRVRVSAELVHCQSGAQVWRNSFDRELLGIFELQDELSRSVAAVLVPALRHAEVQRAERKPAKDLTAHDLYLRALPHMWAGTKDDIEQAIALLRQSLAREVKASSLGALAFSLLVAPPLGALSPVEALPESLEHARRSIELDAEDAFTQTTYGVALAMSRANPDQVILHVEEAVRLNPSSALSWGGLGTARSLLGDFERGIESLELAIRLGPLDDLVYLWLTFLASAHFALERYEDGMAAARRATLRNPNYGTAYRLLAANLALACRTDEARAITDSRDRVQKTTLDEIRAMGLFQLAPVMERYVAAQRLCGVDD